MWREFLLTMLGFNPVILIKCNQLTQKIDIEAEGLVRLLIRLLLFFKAMNPMKEMEVNRLLVY